MRKIVLPCIAAVMAFSASAFAASTDFTGQAAPDFALKGFDGQNLRLSELRGQVVLVNFWATWCGPCRQEMPLLEQIYKQYHGAGLQMLGVNIDDSQDNASQMAHTLGTSFPMLFDDGKKVARQYKVATMPMTYIVGRNGQVRYQHGGYEPGTEQTYLDEVRRLLKE